MNGTRAVLRPVEPAQSGVEATCAACNGRIIFSARKKQTKVVCNVYLSGAWSHVDQFHFDCYAEAGEPYGEAVA